MDFVWTILFALWCEALSLPLRLALSRTPARADVRRLLSRVAGPALLILPIWWGAHIGDWALGRVPGLLWWAALLVLAWRFGARGLSWSQVLAYSDTGETGDGAPSGHSLRRQLWLDGLTLGLLLGFVAIRRWVPEMTTYPIDTSAAEKFMNMMIFWANWHAPALPPEDYWLSGHRLTYYYWGHFHWAWVGRVGGFPAVLAINLGFARLVTGVFEASYLLARALGLRMGAAAAAAVAVTWAGNPSSAAQAVRIWRANPGGFDWTWYDFWKPSRAMADSVITEFPAFSAILGDFHAHHLALPWLLAWLALLVAGGSWLGATSTAGRSPSAARSFWLAALWCGLGLAAALTNLWNLPIMGFGVGLLILHAMIRGRRPAFAALGAAFALAVLVFFSTRLILGADASPLPAGKATGFWESLPIRWLPVELRSTPQQLFAMWGLPVLVLGVASLTRGLREHRWRLVVASLAAWSIALTTWIAVPSWSGAAVCAWLALACWILTLSVGPRGWLSPPAAWMLLGVWVIMTGLELVFINDAYGGEYERYNTYFKLSYPLWEPLGVGAFAVGAHLWQRAPASGSPRRLAPSLVATTRWGLRLGLIAVLAAAVVYPVCATATRLIRAARGDDPAREPTLDAVTFLAHRPPFSEEAPLLAWIRQHVPPGERVAEGVGKGAYGFVGRVASLGGRPVPLGWAHHERQWRGINGHKLTRAREGEVDALYRAESPDDLRRRAAELGVRWVVFGRVERERYGDTSGDAGVLAQLRRAGTLAAAFPADKPTVYLFSLEPAPPQ